MFYLQLIVLATVWIGLLAVVMHSTGMSYRNLMTFLSTFSIFAVLTVVVLVLTGCGAADTEHEVRGDSTVKVVLGVDYSVCEQLEPELKSECIQTLLELLKAAAEGEEKTAFPGIAGGQ